MTNRELTRKICLIVMICSFLYVIISCIYAYIKSRQKFGEPKTKWGDCPEIDNPTMFEGKLIIYSNIKHYKFRNNND